MRVVAAADEPAIVHRRAPASIRCANIEMLGLAACSLVVLLGVALSYLGVARITAPERSPEAGTILDLTRLRGPEPLLPLLTMFGDAAERQAVARALYLRAAAGTPRLDHVGDLATVTIPADVVRGDGRFVELGARLARHPEMTAVPALAPGDITALKPHLVVRTREAFSARIGIAVLWFFGTFWLLHVVRRWRGAADDPVLLPLLMLLCGIGFMTMIALRDPLRDTVAAWTFVSGVAGGLVLLFAASQIDWEASALRRAVLGPLAAALALAALLLVFGTGPGSSGVKVNLFGVQPVEAIRLLVVLALSAYFARRLEFLRELSEPATPSRPWLRYVRLPRIKDVRPVIVSMLLVLAFFFLQKDLGPALVLSCVFLALYGIARGRAAFVLFGLSILLAGFAAAYWIGFPATVRQRVAIWLDPWTNGVAGGDQIAHGFWALSTGAIWGSGAGLGDPGFIPAGHTDFVLAAIGEELGFVGLLVVVSLYALLCWRCLRAALRAPGDYTAFLAVGIALALAVQAFVIGSGLLGLLPLTGVVTPFLSFGRSSMLANFSGIGVLMAIARRRGPVRDHLYAPFRVLAVVLAAAAAAIVMRAGWVQVVKADAFAGASSLSEQADGGYRFSYNPRLLAAAHMLVRGTVYDRNGLPLATSRSDEIGTLADAYRKAGVVPEQPCAPDTGRCYPLGGVTFALLGDWSRQINWGAHNSSYVERDSDAQLQGYDDRQQIVTVVNPRTHARERVVKRDYSELLPLVRHRYAPRSDAARALLTRTRDVRTTIDARLQARAASALRTRLQAGGYSKGAAIVLDAATGEVLASVSYPWPTASDLEPRTAPAAPDDLEERLFDRPRYGLYPPGSTFKLLVAGAALRADRSDREATFMCVRLPDGRVGNYVRGSSRPVRDDVLDRNPHGTVDLRRGLVVSCNAYFAQLAVRIGPKPILDAASLFQIDVARPPTPAGLRRMLPQAGYGQGQVVVSPLKMARIAAAIGRRGLIPAVTWVQTSAPPLPERRFLSDSDAALLARYMRDVITSGTGRSLAANATPIAGKTGTAEVGDGTAHSWFAGFAPYGDAERKIAFAVVVERAGYGARAAAPIAGDLVTAARETDIIR